MPKSHTPHPSHPMPLSPHPVSPHPTPPDWIRLQKALSVEADRGFNDVEGKANTALVNLLA